GCSEWICSGHTSYGESSPKSLRSGRGSLILGLRLQLAGGVLFLLVGHGCHDSLDKSNYDNNPDDQSKPDHSAGIYHQDNCQVCNVEHQGNDGSPDGESVNDDSKNDEYPPFNHSYNPAYGDIADDPIFLLLPCCFINYLPGPNGLINGSF